MRRAPRYLQPGAGLPRPLLWGLAGLSLTAGVLGFTMGRDAAQWSETDAIEAYAALYAQQTGGAPTECMAVPGQPPVWLTIRCGSGAHQRIYPIARNGELIAVREGPST